MKCDCEFEFTLILAGIDELTDDVTDRLFEAGCDDGTVAIRCGRPYITFTRSAESMKNAVLSAIQNVFDANLGLEVVRIEYCNLVTQSDIARRIGRSRQAVNLYIKGQRGQGKFPAPACPLHEPEMLWYWCEVAPWLYENNIITEDVVREAEEVEMINLALELHRSKKNKPDLLQEVEAVIDAYF